MTVKNIDETKVQYTMVEMPASYLGDPCGGDGINVRDCAYIAHEIAKGEKIDIAGDNRGRNVADFNFDGVVNVRDAAAIAKYLVTEKVTDSDKAMNMISDFVIDKKYSAYLKNENDVVTVSVNWRNAGTIENIKAFALRENIDEKLIKYVVEE